MRDPVVHIAGVERGANHVQHVSIETPLIARQVLDLAPVLVADKRRGRRSAKSKIHVPRKGEHLAIARPEVDQQIVVSAKGVAVADSAKGQQRIGPKPLVQIHQLPGLGFQSRAAGQAERLGEGDEPRVIVHLPVVLEDEVVAVDFFVVPQIGDVHAHDVIRRRILVAACIGGGWVVDQFDLPLRSVAAIVIGGANKLVLVPRRENSRSGVSAEGGNQMAQIRLRAGDASRAQQHVPNHDFLLLIDSRISSSRTVHEHDRVNAPEQIIRLELQMKAHARVAVTSPLAAFEANPRVVVGSFFIDHDGARQVFVAHHVGEGMQQRTIRRRQHHAHIVAQAQIGLAIRDHIEGARVRARRRIQRHRAQTVNRPHIELDNGARRRGGDGPGVEAVPVQGHGRGGEGASVDRPPDLA